MLGDADTGAAGVAEADELFVSEAKADGDDLSSGVQEGDASTAEAADADALAVQATEGQAIVAALADLATLAPAVAESEALDAFGDFPPLRLRVDVYDSAGNRLGAGPIAAVFAASYRMELDRIGSFAFDMPAHDERAALLAQGNEVRIYREGEGLVFRGLVDRATRLVGADGSLVLQVSGSSIARRLAWQNTLLGRTFDGSTLASAVGTLLAGSGWSPGILDTPATTLLARFDGLPLWAALAKVGEVFGLHVREDLWDQEVDVGAFGAMGGVVLQNVEAISPTLRENRRLAPVAGLRVLEESADIWSSHSAPARA